MGIWDTYKNRINLTGETKRDEHLNRLKRQLSSKLPDSLSYHSVIVDGLDQMAVIDDSDNFNEKIMYSLPGETFSCGVLVEWADNHWLITEKDANTEVRTKVKMLQCNYLLKWVDEDNIIHEQWCIVEDGTKYMTGEYEDRDFFTTRGDSRIAITIGRNADTVKLGRQNRFLVDDPDSKIKNAYALTKPLKAGHVYNGNGVFSFVLQECVATDNDNYKLGIADYYLHFPKENDKDTDTDTDNSNGSSGKDDTDGTENGGWL
jgi:hypothetical protein